jgi:beta-N-acetylhexosaminidase
MGILIENGFLKEETLRDRACRIISLKDQMGLLDNQGSRVYSFDSKIHRTISMKMIEDSINIVRDRKRLIPFNVTKDTSILHIVIHTDYDEDAHIMDRFTAEMRKYSVNITEMIDPGPDKIFSAVYSGAYNLVICSIRSCISWGINVARLHGKVARNMMDGWMKLGTPVIFISHYHPFIHKDYEAAMDTVINTYNSMEYTCECLMKVITGEQSAGRKILVHD